MKRYFALLVVTALLMTQFSSCKKDKGDPPVLPPAGSMAIDFNNFDQAGKGDYAVPIPKSTPNSNWELASGAAMLWNVIIYTTLAVPVHAFQLAANEDPIYIGDNTWQWSASTTVMNVTYNARLTGQSTPSNNVWKMYISKTGTGGYTDFLWFEGTSKTDGMSGQWKLYESQSNPVEIAKIDWTAEGGKATTVKYTFTKSGNTFAGSNIEYGTTQNTLNAYYSIYYYNNSAEEFFEMDVEWSTTGKNGRISCPKFFGDSDWHCWDSNYLNAECS
ncbi:MAG: hypothetical protein JXR67_02880 [Bacteroidales bacterium]|nr:hypothetical protein [Bacteroidales bacterium]